MTPLCYRLAWLFLIVLCQGEGVFGQHKVWHQYTVEDGLPGDEVWAILQARNNYLWFSTNKGICWYDGYAFRQPVDTSKFAQSEAISPVGMTREGSGLRG
jgi:ligand-binding sensor domain-containing protein